MNKPNTLYTLSILLLLTCLCAPFAANAQREPLMQMPLLSADGKQFTLLRIELAPGTGNDGTAPGHPGDTIVFVESGTVTNRMNNDEVKIFQTGEYWHEAPNDLHAVFRNNDPEIPASVIVFMVNDSDQPLTVGE